MTELKLARCPFCGGEARLYTTESVQSYRRAVVKCEKCFAELRKEGGSYSDFPAIPQVDDKRKASNERAKELATEAWNSRVEQIDNHVLTTHIVRHGGGGWQCINCGRRLSWEFGEGKKSYSHCPQCGARIERGER